MTNSYKNKINNILTASQEISNNNFILICLDQTEQILINNYIYCISKKILKVLSLIWSILIIFFFSRIYKRIILLNIKNQSDH